MPNRDDFTPKTKNILATRVGYKCSNPSCRKQTVGPQEGDDGTINVGVASHIAAAAPGGPRYNSSMTSEERSSISNGIWLCCTCSNLIDRDQIRYTKELLETWKKQAEEEASRELTGRKEDKAVEQIDAYDLSLLINDLVTCNQEQRIFMTMPNVVTNPDNFPLQEDWKKTISKNQKWMGLDLSIEINQICSKICQLKILMSEEKKRIKSKYPKASFRRIADADAAAYCNQLNVITKYLKEHLTDSTIQKMKDIFS